MKIWCFWLISIWFYASVAFAANIDVVPEPNSLHEVLFRAHLRKVADLNLKDRFNPSIFVSYSWDSEEYKRRIHTLCADLEKAGIPANQILLDQWANRPGGPYDLHQFMERIPNSDKVLLFGCPELKRKYEERETHPEGSGIVSHGINLLRNRIVVRGVEGLIPAWFEGQFEDLFPVSLHHISGRQLDIYFFKLFDLLGDIYQTIYLTSQNPIMEIRDKFSVRQSRLRTSSGRAEFHSANGSFPQSLKAYNAFLDRTDDRGLSYLDVIFEELFMNEDERQFSTLTLCARNHSQEVTLSGLGGVGKTTLVTEFAHKYGVFYDLVYWLGGGSREELLRSCLSLLELLKVSIPKRETWDEKSYYSIIIKLVNDHLSRRFQNYLLIIDNVDDPKFVAELAPSNGHVLCTSRYNNWLSRMVDIDVLKREESIALLLQLTGLDPSFSDQARELAEELGDLPLAIAQAAAYIKQQKLPTFEAYLDIYRENQADLLVRQQIQPSLNKRRDIVMTTWSTTMQKLSPDAQKFMSYFAYLAPSAIPVRLFRDIVNCKDIINELGNYSMIQPSEDDVSVHRLVQLVVRLNTENQTNSILKYLLCSIKQPLSDDSDKVDSSANAKELSLISHTETVLNHVRKDETVMTHNIDNISDIITSLSWIYSIKGYYTLGKAILYTFLPYVEQNCEHDSDNVLQTKFYLGMVYGYLREYDNSIKLYEEVLKASQGRVEKSNNNDKRIVSTLHNLAVIHGWYGNYKKQRDVYEIGLERHLENIRQGIEIKGAKFISYITNLANCYGYIGHYEKQRMILEKLQDASDINQDTLNNGQTTIDGSWGIYYGNVDNFSEQHVRFVSMFESGHHKEDHPLMTDIYAKLGEANKNLGYYDVAEQYMQMSLCQKRGEDYRFRGSALKTWGDLYFVQHNLDLALDKFKEALDYQKRVFKEDHPELAQLYRRMGEVYRDQGKTEDAEFYLIKALEIQRIAFDESHPEYVISLKALKKLALL